jgi:prolyl-tRNA synthetase
MFVSADRRGVAFALAPTAEEVATAYAAATLNSYKQLPVCLYQIGPKFRDELRPRGGLLRGREFGMCDAYSFHADGADLQRQFGCMREAYRRIFAAMGLRIVEVQADSGDMGGGRSVEFMVPMGAGEDVLLLEPGTTYAANVETAVAAPLPPVAEQPMALTIVATPDVRSVAELDAFFDGIGPHNMAKTLLLELATAEGPQRAAVMLRGDHELNEAKLKSMAAAHALRMLDPEEIEAATGAVRGFAGPVGLAEDFVLYADEALRGRERLLTGCNQTDHHALGVLFGRDTPMPTFADLRVVRAGEPGPLTGAPLESCRGIEVAHVFELGTRYSEALQATFMNQQGRPSALDMGCYGIGVSRVAAAVAEQHHDATGLRWPMALAPFEVVVAPLDVRRADSMEAAETLARSLSEAGVDVLLDDRRTSPGAKLADVELIGFPLAVVVGRAFRDRGEVELRDRWAQTKQEVPLDGLVARIAERVAQLR